MAEIGSIIDGKRIEKKIAEGGMSVVYLAIDDELKKKWAIKEIKRKGNKKQENDEIIGNSILTEVNVMTKLDHQYLPRIVGIKNNGITSSIIMDYIEGEPLSEVLKKYGAQPEEKVIKWAKQLCEALLYLHTQTPPIIYRDMKPSNVMLKPDDNIRIIDFGIAKEYKGNGLDPNEKPVGTEGYAPPEQYQCHTDVRSDIYALGMTMHHLLTGVKPKKDIVYQPVKYYNPKLSEEIELVIDKCVQPEPENRYQNCSELLYDLEHLEELTRAYKKKQKRKVGLFFASALLTMLFLISGITCGQAATNINNNDYDTLISLSASTSIEQKVDSYKKAIRIYPYRLEAYLKMLEAYQDEEKFSKSENDEFLALYNANKDGFDITSAANAELNYEIGKLYINSYKKEDGSGSLEEFSTRVQKAYPFFQLNYENESISSEFNYKVLSDCYYQICYFYKKYILSNSTVEEASKNSYQDLFNTINNSLNDVKEASPYEQLSLYNAVLMLMYDQRQSMMQVHVNQNDILQIMDTIYQDTKALEKDVNKEQTIKLLNEITNNYASYRDAIIRTYNNAEER